MSKISITENTHKELMFVLGLALLIAAVILNNAITPDQNIWIVLGLIGVSILSAVKGVNILYDLAFNTKPNTELDDEFLDSIFTQYNNKIITNFANIGIVRDDAGRTLFAYESVDSEYLSIHVDQENPIIVFKRVRESSQWVLSAHQLMVVNPDLDSFDYHINNDSNKTLHELYTKIVEIHGTESGPIPRSFYETTQQRS